MYSGTHRPGTISSSSPLEGSQPGRHGDPAAIPAGRHHTWRVRNRGCGRATQSCSTGRHHPWRVRNLPVVIAAHEGEYVAITPGGFATRSGRPPAWR